MRSSRSTQYIATNTPSSVPGLARRLTAPLILLLAALLRFYNLSGQSLWADEGNSVALARRSFTEIARRTAFDIHPPLYYWLLKIWISIFGESEIGLRSLSVALGIGLVYLIGILGTRMFSPRVGLIAAFIAALSPLQVYYSQETRMYMLLTLLSSITVLAAYLILQNNRPESLLTSTSEDGSGRFFWLKTPVGLIYILTVTAGLYTHYAYPLILLVVNLTVLIFWQSQIPNPEYPKGAMSQISNPKSLISNWLLLQLIPILLYLPWLPIAWRQVTTWPSEKQSAPFSIILETISTTLLFGLSWPFDLGLIPVIGLALMLLLTVYYALRFSAQPPLGTLYASERSLPWGRLTLLWFWLLLPIALTVFIFSPAFLKFLLVATPALALLLALVIEGVGCWGAGSMRYAPRTMLGYLTSATLLIVLATASALSLYSYYTDATYARDNYRGIVNFIKAVSGPKDAVILNAEGQQDVFNYYYTANATPEALVYPLPRRRPLDEAETLAELQTIADNASKVHVVYWATQQADPNGLIQGWLDTHLFKATDQWYGNVRLASYASPHTSAKPPLTRVDYHLGPHIRLVGYALSTAQITPGDILQVTLSWQTDAALSPDETYTVFTQVLDQANHLVGQHDVLPRMPTPEWPVNQPVADGHGIFIEPGTPPGSYRLIVGLYDSQTGQRLPVQGGQDFVELGQVEVIRPTMPLPPEAFTIQVPLNAPMLEVTLLGYDLYKLGHRSIPNTPLHSGDPVQLVAYWAAQQPVRGLQDQLFIQVVTNWGEATPIFMTRQPAGMDYPIQEWQEGEIVRAQYNFFLEGLSPGTYRLALTLNSSQVSMQRVMALTKPFRVE